MSRKILSKTQKYMLVRQHEEYGYSTKTLADMYGASVRTVQRLLQERKDYTDGQLKLKILTKASIQVSPQLLADILTVTNKSISHLLNQYSLVSTESMKRIVAEHLSVLAFREAHGIKAEKKDLPPLLDVRIIGAKPGKEYKMHPVDALNG